MMILPTLLSDLRPLQLPIIFFSIWILAIWIIRVWRDYKIMKTGIITKGIVKSYGLSLGVWFPRVYWLGLAAVWVAFATRRNDQVEVVSSIYGGVSPFLRWKPDRDVAVVYDPVYLFAVVVEASPWKMEVDYELQ